MSVLRWSIIVLAVTLGIAYLSWNFSSQSSSGPESVPALVPDAAATSPVAANDVSAPAPSSVDKSDRTSTPSTSGRLIVETDDQYASMADPFNQLLTARSRDDAVWMAENFWPTKEEIDHVDLARDCPIIEIGRDEYSIDSALPRAQLCLAKLYSDRDPRFGAVLKSSALEASSLRFRLEMLDLLSKPLKLSDHERLVSLAVKAWVMGDSQALEVINQIGGVRQMPYDFWAGQLDLARQYQLHAASRGRLPINSRPRPSKR